MEPSRRRLPPLNALRAFEVAGRRLNFRAAADELGVTQGAVAQQVRLLEDHLGVMLFNRLPRGLALTPQGALYLAEVTQAFDRLTEGTARLRAQSEAVTISVTPSFASKLLLPHLPALTAALPEVELRILATETLSDFDRDGVDIAVRLTLPPFPAGQETLRLFPQDLLAVASPHLIANRPLPLTFEQLAELPLLHDTHDHWSEFLQRGNARSSRPRAAFNQTALALDAALAGQGVALACRAFVQSDLQAGRLVQVSRTVQRVAADYYLIRKRSPAPRKAANAVWAWCAAQFVQS